MQWNMICCFVAIAFWCASLGLAIHSYTLVPTGEINNNSATDAMKAQRCQNLALVLALIGLGVCKCCRCASSGK